VDAETFKSLPVTKLLRLKRLVVVEVDGISEEELQYYLDHVVFGIPKEEDSEQEAPAEEDDVVEELPPEFEEHSPDLPVDDVLCAEVPDPPAVEDPPEEVPKPEEVVQPEEEEEVEPGHTLEDLKGMNYRTELQPFAKELGLSAAGTKKNLAARIFDHLESQHVQ
tara:strand:+ start:74 stop:568 length:495 start_codon:yes stop_codon:yes gene_type:complete